MNFLQTGKKMIIGHGWMEGTGLRRRWEGEQGWIMYETSVRKAKEKGPGE